MQRSEVFKHIKAQLQTITELKLITWWNGQQPDNIIHTTPAVFIEFPNPLDTQHLAGNDEQMAELQINVLLASKLLTNNAGEINTDWVATHELLADRIYMALEGTSFKAPSVHINSLMRTGEELNMTSPGMAITKQVFECIITRLQAPQLTMPKPNMEIEY